MKTLLTTLCAAALGMTSATASADWLQKNFNNLTDPNGTLTSHSCNGSPDNTIESIMKEHKDDFDIRIAYCNHGGYVVKHVQMEVHHYDAQGNLNESVWGFGKGLDLSISNGTLMLVKATKLSGTYKVVIKYEIAGGDKKKCKKIINVNETPLNYAKHSKGTTLNNNRCRNWTINNTL